jgi:hypothetical protein
MDEKVRLLPSLLMVVVVVIEEEELLLVDMNKYMKKMMKYY